ncbi:MAG: phosphoribosylamine--glycine ligase [Clostridiaceae bacterium]|nr:phosphoribosylamine--glycine ligase [Clostridiaceae bacterium]
MKILVVGSGGREHAILWKLKQSPRVTNLYCAPGNGGISEISECVPINAMDIDRIVAFAQKEAIDMVVVAPDDPLASGMVDALENAGIRALGPRKNAAIIEASKVFSKDLMKKYNIPSAAYESFSDSKSAKEYIKTAKLPLVVKADGLALGKGVLICNTTEEALEAVSSIMDDKRFGAAGQRIVVEEYMTGPEVSVLAFTDGKTIIPMVSSQDHKRAFDNDQGLNTGGMGAFSPSRVYTKELQEECMKTIFVPTISAMNIEGRPFKGILYFGLMLTSEGPKVLEYNARFGDPETQVVLPRLENDLVEVFDAIIDEKLGTIDLSWKENCAVCVVMASGGYPESYIKGYEITGIESIKNLDDTIVFHAGTKKENGKFYTNGGRVLGVTSVADDIDKAREKAYKAVSTISFKDAHFRKDIGIK